MNTESEINAFFGAIAGGRMLDVATGLGDTITWMIERLQSYGEIIGIDSMDLTEYLKKRSENVFHRENIHFQCMDAHQMTFADASFDTVVIRNSLHHMIDPRQVLREIWRVLKPGGHIVVIEVYRDHQTEEQLSLVYLHDWWAKVDRALGVSHGDTITRAELLALVQAVIPCDLTVFDYANLESDPKDPEQMKYFHSSIDYYLKRAQNLPNYAELEAQTVKLRQRLETIGFRDETVLIAVGQK